MKQLRFGIVGGGRGSSYIKALKASGAVVVAYCEKNENMLQKVKEDGLCEPDAVFYTDYDEFLKHDMDAVLLANYFSEHAPFAIKAMKAGKNVLSETISNITMAEGVELVRTVEETGRLYGLLENYPYQKHTLAMERLYKSGKLGKIVYGEGEYVHPMSPDEQNSLSPGELHWRNWTPRTYYTTHALAPVMQMTDCMPKRVTALASFAPEVAKGTALNTGDAAAIILVETDNHAVFRINGWSYFYPHNSHYRLCCTKGGTEICPSNGKMHISYNPQFKPEDEEGCELFRDYEWPDPEVAQKAEEAGHGGSDFWVIYYSCRAFERGESPYWNVYRATATASVAILAWRSVLNGITYDIPDYTKEEDRKLYESDRISPYPDSNGKADVRASSVPYKPGEDDLENARKYWKEHGLI